MNRKALASAAIGLGVLLLAIGVYQLNQYMISTATASATIRSFGQLGAQVGDYTSQLTTSLAEVSGATLQVIFFDFILGAALVVLGLFYYPEK